MSGAPERIWAHQTDDVYLVAMPHETDGTSYTRDNLIQPLIDKAVAEALERAARVALEQTALPPQYTIKDRWRAEIGKEVAAAIRALVPKGADHE